MALLGQGFDPSGYTPSYAVANAANQDLFNRQVAAQQEIQGAITDYNKEQKALAQKDKEMAAKIKGTLSLLDNAKALYPDFAERIDATKLQLSDPSLSNLDKIGIAGQVENSLNMMTAKGTEATKTALQIAEMQQRERMAGSGAGPKAKMEPRTLYDAQLGRNVEGLINMETGEFKPIVPVGEAPMPMEETGMPSEAMPVSGQSSLGLPPVMAPTMEGPEIPLNESQVIKALENGDEVRMYQGKQYVVPAPSVLPPVSQTEGVQPSPIAGAAALPVSTPPVQQDAIRAAAEMPVSPVAGARFGPPVKSPEEIEAKQRRARLEESQIAANLAATTKQTEEAKAKEEKQVMSEKQKLSAAQDARATIRDAIIDVKKYAGRIGENFAADIAKKGAQYFSSSDQAKLTEAMKPISAKMIWDQMSKLREASATGSTGLGSLTEGERRNLEATVTSLDPMQSPSGIIKGMAKIEDYMRNAEFGNREERKRLVEEGKMTPARYNEIEKGYSKPDIIPETGTIRNTPADKSILDKY